MARHRAHAIAGKLTAFLVIGNFREAKGYLLDTTVGGNTERHGRYDFHIEGKDPAWVKALDFLAPGSVTYPRWSGLSAGTWVVSHKGRRYSITSYLEGTTQPVDIWCVEIEQTIDATTHTVSDVWKWDQTFHSTIVHDALRTQVTVAQTVSHLFLIGGVPFCTTNAGPTALLPDAIEAAKEVFSQSDDYRLAGGKVPLDGFDNVTVASATMAATAKAKHLRAVAPEYFNASLHVVYAEELLRVQTGVATHARAYFRTAPGFYHRFLKSFTTPASPLVRAVKTSAPVLLPAALFALGYKARSLRPRKIRVVVRTVDEGPLMMFPQLSLASPAGTAVLRVYILLLAAKKLCLAILAQLYAKYKRRTLAGDALRLAVKTGSAVRDLVAKQPVAYWGNFALYKAAATLLPSPLFFLKYWFLLRMYLARFSPAMMSTNTPHTENEVKACLKRQLGEAKSAKIIGRLYPNGRPRLNVLGEAWGEMKQGVFWNMVDTLKVVAPVFRGVRDLARARNEALQDSQAESRRTGMDITRTNVLMGVKGPVIDKDVARAQAQLDAANTALDKYVAETLTNMKRQNTVGAGPTISELFWRLLNTNAPLSRSGVKQMAAALGINMPGSVTNQRDRAVESAFNLPTPAILRNPNGQVQLVGGKPLKCYRSERAALVRAAIPPQVGVVVVDISHPIVMLDVCQKGLQMKDLSPRSVVNVGYGNTRDNHAVPETWMLPCYPRVGMVNVAPSMAVQCHRTTASVTTTHTWLHGTGSFSPFRMMTPY